MPEIYVLQGHASIKKPEEYETTWLDKIGPQKAIKPVRITGRTPAQIVLDAETSWLEPCLVRADKLSHFAECRCGECILDRLDALIRAQEQTITELGGQNARA